VPLFIHYATPVIGKNVSLAIPHACQVSHLWRPSQHPTTIWSRHFAPSCNARTFCHPDVLTSAPGGTSVSVRSLDLGCGQHRRTVKELFHVPLASIHHLPSQNYIDIVLSHVVSRLAPRHLRRKVPRGRVQSMSLPNTPRRSRQGDVFSGKKSPKAIAA
jgi:hypothetical protein